MYQVYNVFTNEPQPYRSETPYELAGPLADRRIEQKRDEQGNLLYLKFVEKVVEVDNQVFSTGIFEEEETTEAVAVMTITDYETGESTSNEYPNQPIMVDAGPLYEWREIILSLADIKSAQKAIIDAAKDMEEAASPFMYMDKPFDFDPKSRERLNGAIQLAQSLKIFGVPGTTKVTDWKLADNTMYPGGLTVDMLCNMPQAFAGRSEMLHQKAWALKAQIDQATTEEEVKSKNWGL